MYTCLLHDIILVIDVHKNDFKIYAKFGDEIMKDIIKRLNRFRDERDWKQFHTPENLSKSIVIEAAELLELYQWSRNDEDVNRVEEEVADIMAYCLMLCDHYGFDVETIMNKKIDKNEEKYPIEKAFGKSDKYNKL